MGLDMYLEKINKKMTQKEFDDSEKILNKIENFDKMKELIDKVKCYKSIKKYVLERYKTELQEYDDYKNEDHYDCRVYNSFDENIKHYSDFDTKEDLIKYYIKDINKFIFQTRIRIGNLEKNKNFINHYNNKNKYILESKEIAYWRKHADLNNYFTLIAKSRLGNEEFNCKYLVLEKQDIAILNNKINSYLNKTYSFNKGEGFFWGNSDRNDWIYTKKIFDDILTTFDFDHETLLYCCWY